MSRVHAPCMAAHDKSGRLAASRSKIVVCSVYGLRSLAAVASRSPLTTALISDNIVLLRSTLMRLVADRLFFTVQYPVLRRSTVLQ